MAMVVVMVLYGPPVQCSTVGLGLPWSRETRHSWEGGVMTLKTTLMTTLMTTMMTTTRTQAGEEAATVLEHPGELAPGDQGEYPGFG